MLESRYVENETVPAFDETISKFVSSYGLHGGGNEMAIAIENAQGRIYRVIASTGMGAYIHATSALIGLGLRDLLVDSLSGKNGYDSWFVVTPDVLNDEPPTEVMSKDAASEILREMDTLSVLTETERQSIVLSRVGQGMFRAQLVSYWGVCAVTGASSVSLLKASHVKPWRSSSNRERLDV